MSSAPSAVLSEALAERLDRRRLLAAVFTTYQFDGGFFEQQVLPVILDVPLSHATPIKLMQLEPALAGVPHGVAVFYDLAGIVSAAEFGSPKLGFGRVPVRMNKGKFHPKNIFLLVEEPARNGETSPERSLIVGALSANLTRSGWWQNVEACHFEEVGSGDFTRLKKDLGSFLGWLRGRAQSDAVARPLQAILDFIASTDQRARRQTDGRLHTHFYGGRLPLVEFLGDVTRGRLNGLNLDVISPYFDDAATCEPLENLIKQFNLKDVRVFLPRDAAGAAVCSAGIYDAIRRTERASWARLPDSKLLRLGAATDAGKRFVHAKVYRFYSERPKVEIVMVGSVNLTRPAHHGGINMESGFVVENDPSDSPTSWLVKERDRPLAFALASAMDDEADSVRSTRLQLRYHWDRRQAEGYWDDAKASPELVLKARSINLGTVRPLEPRTWTVLPETLALQLARVLPETSFVWVAGDGEGEALLLVQEEGLLGKPSLLQALSVSDILKYWSLLTAEQRTAFVEARAPEVASTQDGAALVAAVRLRPKGDTLFDRFAGFFHAFASVERAVDVAIEEGNLEEAAYRLFGRKFDSLGTLLERVQAPDAVRDDVERYVIYLCAEQLCREVRSRHPEFWKTYPEESRKLAQLLDETEVVRGRLGGRSEEMPAFLDWFQGWFLKRAHAPEVEP